MSSTEMSSVQSFIQPLFYIKAIWKGSGGGAEDLYHNISGKMMEVHKPRTDVLQIAHAFAMRAKIEGASYESNIEGWLRAYNERANTKQISDLEARVIKIVPLQTQALQQQIAYNWQNFKIDETALPYSQLSSDAWLFGTKPRDSTNALWSTIQAANPEKRQFSVQRKIGVFLKALNDAKRLRKRINLKYHCWELS